jgi:hypothetical protein
MAFAPDRTLVAVIEAIAEAWRAEVRGPAEEEEQGESIGDAGAAPDSAVAVPARAAAPDVVRAAGAAAAALLRELVKSTAGPGVAGEGTVGGGLFLLTRALLDVRLHLLAHEAQVPFDVLRGALAVQWLDLGPPFDGPTSLWVGASTPDFAVLETPSVRLDELERSLLDLLVGQRALDKPTSDGPVPNDSARHWAAVGLSEHTRAILGRIAWMVTRAWSRWIPGIGNASVPFVFANCLRRAARVRVSADLIEVALDPAPLDVVVEMAGYFRPIEAVPWLDGRTMTFAVRRPPGA